MNGHIVKFLAAAMIFTSGCAFSSKETGLIREGMSEAQVIQILGRPSESQELGRSKTLAYWFPRNPLTRGAVWPGQDAFVVYFEDGLVASFGKEGKSQTPARGQASIT